MAKPNTTTDTKNATPSPTKGKALKRPAKAKKGETPGSFFSQQILEFSPIAFIVVDEEHIIQFVNQKTEELFGYPRQELTGKNINILIPSRFHAVHKEYKDSYFEEPRKRAMGAQHDISGLHRDGREIPIEIGLNPVEIDGRVYVLASITNITVQKAFEQSNEDNSRKYHNLFENSLDSILVVDDEQRYVDVNPAACAMLGYTKEEFLSMRIQDIVTTGVDIKEKLWGDFINKKSQQNTIFLKRKDGTVILTEYMALANFMPGLHVSLCRDVTARYMAETKLRESEKNLSAILQTLLDGVVMVSTESEIIFANKAAETILGIKQDNITGKYFNSREWQQLDEFDTPFPFDKLPLAVAMREKRPVDNMEHAIVSPDGEKKWLTVNAAPLFDEDGKIYGAIAGFQDTTERKNADAKLAKSNERFKNLYEQEQHQARELALFNKITESILTSKDLSRTLHELAENLAKLINADDCYITRWDEEKNQAIPQATTASLNEPFTYIPQRSETSMTESVLNAGQALVAQDTLNSPYISRSIAERYPSRSILGVPLIFREHKLGAVIIAFNTTHQFTQDEIQLSERAANHIVIALWNSLQENEIKQRLKQQETLARITTTLSQMERVGLPNVLDMIVLSTRELIPTAQQAVIHLMDKEQLFLIPEAVSGFDLLDKSSRKMRVGEGIAGLVISENRDIYIPSVDEDERFIHLNPNASYKSLLVSPILSGEKKFGTISIQSDKPHAFSKNEISLLSELGQQAAIAIENARLYDAAQQELQERIEAESRLRASEERYRSVSEDVDALICRFLSDGTLVFTNTAYGRFYEKSPMELQGSNLLVLIPEGQRKFVQESYLGLTAEKPSITYETQEINYRGETRWIQWTDRLIKIAEAGRYEYQSIGIDITERKTAELERERLLRLAQEQRLLAETSANATLALVSHTETKQVLNEILFQVQKLIPGCAANIALLEKNVLRTAAWRGYEGRGDEVFISLFKETRLFPIEQRIMKNPSPIIVEDTREFDGWQFLEGLEWIRSHISIPLMWNDQLLGLLYLDEDTPGKFTQETIQRLKPLINATTVALESALLIETTQQALKETSALYRINQGMVALETEDLLNDVVDLLKNNFDYYHVQFFMLNPETGNFKLKAASGEVGKKLVGSGHELRAGLGIIGYAAETGTPFFTNNVDEVVFFLFDPYLPNTKAEMAIPVKNGDKLYGILDIQQVGTKSFTDRDQQLVLAVADQLAVALHKAEIYKDLQISLEQEKAIRNQLIQNERLAVMGRLLASVSHELNNPLQAIQNALFLLKEERGISPQGHNDLNIVLAESERMASMIERLRTTYRPTQAEDLQHTNLNTIFEDVLALLATHLRKNGVTLEFHPNEDLPDIMAISDQIRQVVLNLLMNAVEAMPNGGKLTVSTQYMSESHEILLSIKDTGVGISPEILPYIFDPFVTNKKRGTGLGLTISHDIIIKHRGRITAENNHDLGATFNVWLPTTTLPAEIE